MHGNYVGHNIILDTEFYYLYDNTYDEDYDFTIYFCVHH